MKRELYSATNGQKFHTVPLNCISDDTALGGSKSDVFLISRTVTLDEDLNFINASMLKNEMIKISLQV